MVEPVGQADDVDDGVPPLRVGLASGDGQGQKDVLASREGWHEVELLEDESDPFTSQQRQLPVGEGGDIGLADEGATRSGAVEPGHAVHERRFTRSRRTHDRGEGTGLDGDAHPVEGLDDGISGSVSLDEFIGGSGGRRHDGLL